MCHREEECVLHHATDAIFHVQISLNVVDIFPNVRLTMPLRCACPTTRQLHEGIRYLMTYVIQSGDSFLTIANKFGAGFGQILGVNIILPNSSIQPFTTLLVPLQNPHNTTILVLLQNHKSYSRISIVVSLPIVVAILLFFGACFCIYYRRGKKLSQCN